MGTALVRKLEERGHSVTVVSRNPEHATAALGVPAIEWTREELGPAVARADAVVNLSGQSVVARRWNPLFKEELRASRIDPTTLLSSFEPKVLVQASAIGLYGDRGDDEITETSPPATDFFGVLCAQWEASARAERLAVLRIGQVLGSGGGALEGMLRPPMVPFSPWSVGLGGALGSGRQWMSWIHLSDVVSAMLWALETPSATGAFNLVSPNPVRGADFARALGKALGKPALVSVPGFALDVLVGEFAKYLLASQRVIPTRLQQQGFSFRYPELEPALNSLLRTR